MSNEKRKNLFKQAVEDLGHEISFLENKRISIQKFSDNYNVPIKLILKAIEEKKLGAHYDYKKDEVWVDVMEACYFAYCLEFDKSNTN